jgi:hypothetical protein
VTNDDHSEPLTARDIFFDDPASSETAIEDALIANDLLESLPNHLPSVTPAAKKFVLAQAAHAIDGVLGALGIEEVLLGGWMHVEELHAAIEETRTDGGTRHVALASHSIASEHAPGLELMVNQAPVRLLDLRLALNFVIDACELVVKNGKVEEVTLGSVSASGELGTAARTILKHAIERLDGNRLFKKTWPAPAV